MTTPPKPDEAPTCEGCGGVVGDDIDSDRFEIFVDFMTGENPTGWCHDCVPPDEI